MHVIDQKRIEAFSNTIKVYYNITENISTFFSFYLVFHTNIILLVRMFSIQILSIIYQKPHIFMALYIDVCIIPIHPTCIHPHMCYNINMKNICMPFIFSPIICGI